MESYGVHEVLAIKSHQTQWNLMGPWDFSNQISPNSWNLMGSMKFSNQISSNRMESYGVHDVLAIKSHQIQWNLVGSMRF